MEDRVTILDLCGGTGSWSRPYADAGYNVEVIDLSRAHDVRLLEAGKLPEVRGVLAAPPCTVFASSGARWKRSVGEMKEALAIVDACLRVVFAVRPKWWALENPVGKLTRYLGKPKMYFNPCDYGDPYTKKTGIWGEFTPPQPTPVAPVEKSPIHHASPGLERAMTRSITPSGFARAFFEANP